MRVCADRAAHACKRDWSSLARDGYGKEPYSRNDKHLPACRSFRHLPTGAGAASKLRAIAFLRGMSQRAAYTLAISSLLLDRLGYNHPQNPYRLPPRARPSIVLTRSTRRSRPSRPARARILAVRLEDGAVGTKTSVTSSHTRQSGSRHQTHSGSHRSARGDAHAQPRRARLGACCCSMLS